VAVGTAICNAIGDSLVDGLASGSTLPDLRAMVQGLAEGVRRART
jgi:hypothetical protein